MELGKMIKDRREELGLSQAQLAEKVGTKQGYVADIERGRKHPSIATLTPFVAALKGEITILWKPGNK